MNNCGRVLNNGTIIIISEVGKRRRKGKQENKKDNNTMEINEEVYGVSKKERMVPGSEQIILWSFWRR